MDTDKFGQIILSEQDICHFFLKNHDGDIKQCLVMDNIPFNPELELVNIPKLLEYIPPIVEDITEFDAVLQQNWHMADEYKSFDIVEFVINECNTDEERQRVGDELLLYLELDLFPLLRYLKYLVDTMRKYNIVWGVGRGSSTSSYVLYLIGVHKINSMYYDLDFREFLRKE